MGAFVDGGLFQRDLPALGLAVDNDALAVVAADSLVHLAFGHAREPEANRPAFSIEDCGGDFSEAHAGGYAISCD